LRDVRTSRLSRGGPKARASLPPRCSCGGLLRHEGLVSSRIMI
jgi:hypothetical protein